MAFLIEFLRFPKSRVCLFSYLVAKMLGFSDEVDSPALKVVFLTWGT